MSPRHRFGIGISLGVAGALIGLLLATSPSGARASPPPNRQFSASQELPDPRWLDILRASPSGGIRLQSATPSLHVHLTDRMVAGRVPVPSPVSVQVRRGGIIVATATAHPFPDGDGYLYVASPAYVYPDGCGGPCGCFSFQPGDEIRAIQGSTIISLTVPPLTALADPAADVVLGTAPPSDTVTLYLYPRADPSAVLTTTAPADPEGHYEANWQPTDLRPGDTGHVAWNADPYRAAYLRFVAPLLQVQWNGSEVLGMAAPCSTIHLIARDAEGQWLMDTWAWADRYGYFQAWLYWAEKEEGVQRLYPGSRIIAEAADQTFAATVLSMSAHADREGGVVVGSAPAGAALRALRFPGPLRYRRSIGESPPNEEVTGTADATGWYTLPLALAAADYGAVFAAGPDGHETFARFAVPYLFARLGPRGPMAVVPNSVRLWGQVDGANLPITIAVDGPRGYPKDLRFLTSGVGGEFSDLTSDSDVILETGDTITVSTSEGVRVALRLPTLTAHADPLSETVSGEAPPGARLEVFVYAAPLTPYGGGGGEPPPPPYSPVSRVVTATAEGTYVADFRGLADITPESVGEVVLYLSEDAAVSRPFFPACRPILTHVVVGGNSLAGLSGKGCPSATITLQNPAGQIKAQAVADFQWWAGFEFYFYLTEVCPWPGPCYGKSIPVLILPGDRIVLQSAGQTYTVSVPTLTLEILPTALSGQAPPGETLRAEFYDNSGMFHRLTTTVTAQGTYTIPLAGIRPAPGGLVYVYWCPGDTCFVARDGIPLLQAALFNNRISGLLRPLSPYTVTPMVATGYAGPYGEFSAPTQPLLPGERVTVTTPRDVLSLTIPFLSAKVDRAAGTVSGEAPPSAPLKITLNYGYPYYFSLSQYVTATGAGTYTVSFPELPRFDYGSGSVEYFTPEGHQIFLNFRLRQWSIRLEDPCIGGYADVEVAPFTVTLRADSEEEVVTGVTWYDGSFYACFSRPIHPGDHLTLTQMGAPMTFTVPVLTAIHDFGEQVLEGEAPPGSLLEAVFQETYSHSQATRRTRADPSGRYRLDTSDLSLRPGQRGYVQATDAEGNIVRADFTIWGYRVFLPIVLR